MSDLAQNVTFDSFDSNIASKLRRYVYRKTKHNFVADLYYAGNNNIIDWFWQNRQTRSILFGRLSNGSM